MLQWLKTEELTQGSSTAIKIENPNQFVPLFTNPQEVIETRNKVSLSSRLPLNTPQINQYIHQAHFIVLRFDNRIVRILRQQDHSHKSSQVS